MVSAGLDRRILFFDVSQKMYMFFARIARAKSSTDDNVVWFFVCLERYSELKTITAPHAVSSMVVYNNGVNIAVGTSIGKHIYIYTCLYV